LIPDFKPEKSNDYEKATQSYVTPTSCHSVNEVSGEGRYIGLRHTVVFGGVKQCLRPRPCKRGGYTYCAPQIAHLMNQGFISLRDIEIFVLDEAD
jgi:ATP-dependent RNA helicase RhlE